MSNEGDYGSDFGSTDLDPQEKKNAQTYLEDPNDSDDEPWSPPERQPRGAEFVDVEDETLDQRLDQEEPDEGTAYGDPSERPDPEGQMVGGDDPDAIPAQEDFVGDPAEVDDTAAHRPRDPNEPAEEAALHVVDDDEMSPAEEEIDLEDEDAEYED